MSCTLAVDFGSRNIGVALVEHAPDAPNRVLYAGTIVVDAKPLNSAVQPRAMARRMRRTRKTHERRLRRLAQALHGVPNADHVVRFCRRRGYSYEPEEETDEGTRALSFSRAEFFDALRREIQQSIPIQQQDQVLRACSKHLNETRRRDAELRPARFENRGPTKCQWEGCRRNVPRAGNDAKGRLQQALYVWTKPVFDVSENAGALRRSIDHWIAELDALARWYRKTRTLDEAAAKEERKKIDRRKNHVYKNLRERVGRECTGDLIEQFKENWGRTYSRNLTDIVHGGQGGRVRYCREHSLRFVDYFLAGKQIPSRAEVFESDLFGRTQQILFRRIWRFVECRLLPLADGHIDRVVVERVAFDVLAGKAKNRREVPEDKAAEMYWHGPQYGFSSRLEMFKKEFDGRYAYCGRQNAIHEVEHLLPRSQFAFDSYLNILPACSTCNSQKGPRTAFAARMSVHQDAYQAYSDYVGRLKTPHLFHTIKKGMLKLLARSGNGNEVEKELGMLANNLVTITSTQKGPRPLARFLASGLEGLTQKPCHASWTSGRHTALYHSILLPEYRKAEEKEKGDLINHAVDAIILGCDLPSATAIENPRWYARAQDLIAWREKVQENGPVLTNGLPQVEPVELMPFFEDGLGDGYSKIDLSAFNWNRSRQSGHKLDPVGVTQNGQPIKPSVTVHTPVDAASRRVFRRYRGPFARTKRRDAASTVADP